MSADIGKAFQKHEHRLRLQHIQERGWTEKLRVARCGEGVFKVPPPPKNKRTFYWTIEPPTKGDEPPRPYRVKFTPNLEKRWKIPDRMFNQKRIFLSRRDTRIAFSDATFRPLKKSKREKELEELEDVKEFTEQELRNVKDYESFFESWDECNYTEEEMFDLMCNAIDDRLLVYLEVYKQTSDTAYLAEAAFLKFLDLNELSDLHRMYLILSEECEFPMSYVECILRRHY